MTSTSVSLPLVYLCLFLPYFLFGNVSGSNISRANVTKTLNVRKSLAKRSIVTFPPDSVLQINMGIALTGKLEHNSATLVLAFQQNAPVITDTQHLIPSVVESGRQFSIYDHLRKVISNYGFHGSECLKKMICEIGGTPLLGGLMEDVLTFVLSPSKHRSIQENNENSLLDSEQFGKAGGNCTSAYPLCINSLLDYVSTFVHL